MFAGSPSGRTSEDRITLDDLAREGARRMIAAALEAEVGEYIAAFAEELGEDGKRLVVRNGHARERRVTVGSGTLAIRAPRVNDKRVEEDTGERRRFGSRILPAYARRSPKVTEVLPILYLHGLSTGDFGPALRDLLGEDASGLSASSIARLTEAWQAEHAAFRTRELRFHRYAYLFVDGVNVAVRLGEDDRLCLLVVIGVREDGCEGAARGRGRLPGVGRLVGGRVPRSARPRAERAEARDRRRRARRVGRAPGRVPRRPRATLLGSQDSERIGLAAQAAAAAREEPAARDGRGPQPGGRPQGAGAVPLRVRRQVPEGGREARQGLGRAHRVLRLPRRALAAPTDDEPDREQASRP